MDAGNIMDMEIDFDDDDYIELGGWTQEMIDMRQAYKDANADVKIHHDAYKAKVRSIQEEVERSRRVCLRCRIENRMCDFGRPCAACLVHNPEETCSLVAPAQRPLRGMARPPWLWELTTSEHSDLAHIAMAWRDSLNESITGRLKFWAPFPYAWFPTFEKRVSPQLMQSLKV